MDEISVTREITIVTHNVEDDGCLLSTLTASGFAIRRASNLENLKQSVAASPPDLMLLRVSGITSEHIFFLKYLRDNFSSRALPIIVIVTQTDEVDRVAAFEAGADGLMSEPFSTAELLARIEALLRRSSAPHRNLVRVGDVELDRDAFCIRRCGKVLTLSQIDYRLARFLLENPGRVHSRDDIRRSVWGNDDSIDLRTVDVYILRLRKSFAIEGRQDPIQSLRGVGYKFNPTQ